MSDRSRSKVSMLAWLVLGLILCAAPGARLMAQNPPLRAAITAIDAGAFPRMVVSVAVFDDQGGREGLGPADFELVEDEVQAAAITAIEPDQAQPVRVVVAIDVSMPPRDLAQIKEAVAALLESVGPQDKIAIISFADEAVQLTPRFTNNRSDLTGLIDELASGGNFTASHAALAQAVSLLEGETDGRQAVILVADSRDNTGGNRIDDTLRRAQAANLPLYVIGFGPKTQNDPLRDRLDATGGQYVNLATAGEVGPELQRLGALLRQGYKLTYLSTLPADNQPHQLTVRVTDQGRSAAASRSFVAASRPLPVAVMGLSPGQTITEAVTLTSLVQTTAPTAEVTYFLDNEQVATRQTAPYAYTWSTPTDSPGPHRLTVTARDSAGNTGQTGLSFAVAQPLQVTLPATQTRFEVGQTISIPVTIETDAELVAVEYFLDGRPQGRQSSPPYNLTLDGSETQAGDYTLTVAVTNALGQSAAANLALQLTPPPPESTLARLIRTWLGLNRDTVAVGLFLLEKFIVTAAALTAIIFGLVAAFVILRAVARSHRKFSRQIRPLQIANAGNILSHYQLQVQEATGALKFRLTMHGQPLPWFGSDSEPGAVSQPDAPTGPASSPVSDSRRRPNLGQAMQHAQTASSTAQGCLSPIAGIFQTLAQLLPGSLGRSARGVGQRFSAGESAIRRTTQAPQRVMTTAGRLQGQVGQLVPQTGGSAGYGPSRPASRPPEPVGPAAPGAPTAINVPAAGRTGAMTRWAETPGVEPGQTLTINLVIDPVDPYRRQIYPFIIHSRVAEEPETTVLSESAQVEIPGISWFRRWLPVAAVAVLLLVLVMGVLYLAIWRLASVDLLEWVAVSEPVIAALVRI